MSKLKFPHVGMRTIKTSASVVICLALGQLIDRNAGLVACVAAILTMRENMNNSISYGITRMLSTLFGGVLGFALLFLESLVPNAWVWIRIPVAGLAVIFMIQLTVAVKRRDTSAIAAISVLVITLTPTDSGIFIPALRRISETAVGIVVAIIVNKFLNFRKPNGNADPTPNG